MKYKIFIMLSILIFVVQNQAQEIERVNVKDHVFNLSMRDLKFNNFSKFNINNVLGYSSLNRFDGISALQNPNFNPPKFVHFDICLNAGLKHELEEQYKYDLGTVGEYLGLTKDAAAILICILSLL